MMAGDEGSRLVMRDSGPVIDLDLSTTMTGRMRNDGALLLPLVHFSHDPAVLLNSPASVVVCTP